MRGRSILITSAPKSAKSLVQYGADTISPSSTIFRSDSAPTIEAPEPPMFRRVRSCSLDRQSVGRRRNSSFEIHGRRRQHEFVSIVDRAIRRQLVEHELL